MATRRHAVQRLQLLAARREAELRGECVPKLEFGNEG